MRLTLQTLGVLLLTLSTAAYAAPLKPGQACELEDRAKLFKALEGDDIISKLAAESTVSLKEYKQGRWLVTAGEQTGYIDAKWLRKICGLVKASQSGEAVSAKDAEASATTEVDPAQEPELELTLDLPAEASEDKAEKAPATAEEKPAEPTTEPAAKTEALDPAPKAEAKTEPKVTKESAPKTAAKAPTAAPKTEPAPSAEVKVVNKPKLVDVIRPAFALHESFTGSKRARVVVLDTRVDAVSELALDGSGMAAIISAELTKVVAGKADVVARSDMATLIQRMEEAQLMGCSEPSCMTDIATLAEADLLVSSNVTPAGEGFTLALELLEAASGRALRRETVTWTGSTRGIVELCAPQVVKLVGAKQGQAFSGAVQLVATEDEAEVYVDEQLVGVTPLDIFPNLDIGKHTIRVSKPGYKLFEIPVVVNRDGTSVVQAELIKPWYKEWWVWTAAGAVLTGSVTAYILANQGEDPTIYEVNSAISDSLRGTSR